MTAECDVIVIASPLTPETEGLFDRETLFAMKRGAYIVNIARGAIVEIDALVEALEEGHLGGTPGDVWYPEPAPSDHPWRQHAPARHDPARLRYHPRRLRSVTLRASATA